MRITKRENNLSEISEITPRKFMLCWECFDRVKDEPMWSQVIGGMHGNGLAIYCKKCFPTKESILDR